MIRNPSDWELMSKEIHTERKGEKKSTHLLVLYTVMEWKWCESCRTLENATRFVRSILKHRNILSAGANLKVVTVDCSAMLPFLATSPCSDVESYPTATLVTEFGEGKEERWLYNGMSDVHGILKFLGKKLPTIVTNSFLSNTIPAEFRQPPEDRIAPTTVSSNLKRMSERDLSEFVVEYPHHVVVVFLYSLSCRNCANGMNLVEDAARHFDALLVQNISFVRTVVDENIRGKWLVDKDDVPQILVFRARSEFTASEAPAIYQGPRDTSNFLLFLQLVLKMTFPIPHLSEVRNQFANLLPRSSTASVTLLRSPRDVAAELSAGRAEAPTAVRFLFVASFWTIGTQQASKELSEYLNALTTFYSLTSQSPDDRRRATFALVDGTQPEQLRQMLQTTFKRYLCPSPPCLLRSLPSDGDEFFPFPSATTEINILSFIDEVNGPVHSIRSGINAAKNRHRRGTVIPITGLQPILKVGPADDLEMAVLRGKSHVFGLVHTHQTDNATRMDTNRLAWTSFESVCQLLQTLPNSSMAKETATDPSETLCVSIDGQQAKEAFDFLIEAATDDESIRNRLRVTPFVVRFGLTEIRGSGPLQALFTNPENLLFLNRDRLADSLIQISGMHPRLAEVVKELNGNTFEPTVQEPTTGALVLFYHKHCEHSKALLPTFELVAKVFKKDQRDVVIAQIDVEYSMDDGLRRQYKVDHYPEIRWFPKNSFNKGTGEVFPSTPYKDSLVEFVSEEMGYPSLELEELDHKTIQTLTKLNFEEVMVRNADKSHSVLLLFESLSKEKRRIEVLRTVEQLFQGTKEFAQPEDQYARKRNEHNFNFYKIDGLRYKKLLSQNGFDQILKKNSLPLLAFMPRGSLKTTRIQLFQATPNVTEAHFTEIGVARWLLQRVAPERFGRSDKDKLSAEVLKLLNFTDAHKEAEEMAESQLGLIAELDGTHSVVNFTTSPGTAVMFYYATWCDFCKKAMPHYVEVAKHYEGDTDIRFGRIDVPTFAEAGHHQGIQAFPTIIVYFEGSLRKHEGHGEVWNGVLDDPKKLISYIDGIRGTSKVGELDRKFDDMVHRVLELNDTNWDTIVEQGDAHVLVEFYAPWCGHCRTMVPVLDELRKFYTENPTTGHPVVVAKVDGTTQNRIADKFGVKDTFPVILFLVRNATDGTYKSVQYEESFFVDQVQKWMEKNVIALQTARVNAGFQRKKPTPGGAGGNKKDAKPPLDKPSQEQKKRPERPEKQEKPKQPTGTRGKPQAPKLRTWDATAPKPRDHFFSEEVKLMNEAYLRKELNKTTVVLVLRYKFPQHRRMALIWSSMTNMLGRLVRTGRLLITAVPQYDDSVYEDRELPHVTIYRGLAKPQVVEFVSVPIVPPAGQLDSWSVRDDIDDEKSFIIRMESTPNTVGKGVGGCVYNLTHLGDFVQEHYLSAIRGAKELTEQNFNIVVHNASTTAIVFFYEPTCRPCRTLSEQYEAVGQALSHRIDLTFGVVDTSKHQDTYDKFGNRKLPLIVAFDIHDESLEGPASDQKPFYRVLHWTSALPKRNDIYDFVLNRPLKSTSKVSVLTIDTVTGDVVRGGSAADVLPLTHPLSAASKTELSYLMQKHVTDTKSVGSLLLLVTGEWSSTTPQHKLTFLEVTQRLKNRVVVAQYDVEAVDGPREQFEREVAGLKADFGVRQVPAILLYRRGHSLKEPIEYFGPKLNADEVVTFVRNHTESVSQEATDFIPSYRRATPKDVRELQQYAAPQPLEFSSSLVSSLPTYTAPAPEGIKAQVVFLLAPWCGPTCDEVKDTARAAASQLVATPTQISTVTIKKNELKELKEKFGMQSVPFIIIRCLARPQFEGQDQLTVAPHTLKCSATVPACRTPANLVRLVEEECLQYYVAPKPVKEAEPAPQEEESIATESDEEENEDEEVPFAAREARPKQREAPLPRETELGEDL